MFMTMPKVIVGDLSLPETRNEYVDNAYSQVRTAFGATPLAMPQRNKGLLPTLTGVPSDIAASVVSDLLSNHPHPHPTALIDCRSATMLDGPAPTYRLAAGCGLQRVKCWSLSGLGGNEVAEAILQLSTLKLQAAVISAVQTIQHQDTRTIANGYSLGDAGAAVMLSMTRPSNGLSLRVHGCAVAQLRLGELPEPHHFRALATEACKCGSIQTTAIRWCFAQRVSAPFLNSVENAFPRLSCDHPLRPHPEVNFGCADVFISLTLSESKRVGMGVLIFGGRFGSLGLVLLDDRNNV